MEPLRWNRYVCSMWVIIDKDGKEWSLCRDSFALSRCRVLNPIIIGGDSFYPPLEMRFKLPVDNPRQSCDGGG